MCVCGPKGKKNPQEEFRKYLEKSNVIDALTKVLVTLYEEPDRPEKPVEFIKKALGGPSQNGVPFLLSIILAPRF